MEEPNPHDRLDHMMEQAGKAIRDNQLGKILQRLDSIETRLQHISEALGVHFNLYYGKGK